MSEILPCHLSSKQVIMKAVSKESENEDKQYIHQSAGGWESVHSEAAGGWKCLSFKQAYEGLPPKERVDL